MMVHMLEFFPYKIKNINIKAFNFISAVSETIFLVQHESRECKYRLNGSVCNSKQKWNRDECRCESKDLDDRVLAKKVIYGILACMIENAVKHVN